MEFMDFQNCNNKGDLLIDISDNTSIASSFEVLDYYCSPTPPTSPTLKRRPAPCYIREPDYIAEMLYSACQDEHLLLTDSPLISPCSMTARPGSGCFDNPVVAPAATPPTILCRYGGVDPLRVQMQLLDAQRELTTSSTRQYHSGSTSGTSSNTVHSLGLGEISTLQNCKGLRQEGNNEWIWNWKSYSDRSGPHKDYNGIFCRLKQTIKENNNISLLIVSHACSFFIGATCMLIYLRRFWRISSFTVDI